ncbi:MAG: division plane positioning ATPase MipZ [Caulobacterales bacterium]|nr:division plane positioning ATPase MipZ [Caulobacterales bacterium]
MTHAAIVASRSRTPSSMRRGLRVVVVSGPRGGAGRTSLVAHLAVAMLNLGREAGVMDLDLRHRGLTRWLSQRARRAREADATLVLPAAPIDWLPATASDPAREEQDALERWSEVLASMGGVCDIALVDAPSGGGALSRRVHESADLVISLVAESAADLDLMFEADEHGERSARPGSYARMVWEARRKRSQRGAPPFAWVLARGRALAEGREMFDAPFDEAARLLGVRPGPRLRERALWRQGMEAGMTVLDPGAASRDGREQVAGELRRFMIVAKIPGLEGAELTF